MADLAESGYTVRLLLRDEVDADESFLYWGDRLPYAGQFIEVTSESYRGAIEARVSHITPDADFEIHASELGV